jgi:dihydrofolate synthase/folylpolyglutamate synthase
MSSLDLPACGAAAEPPCSARDAAVDYLMGRINYERVAVAPYGERQLKLDRMRTLLNRLGNPDAGMPIIHVAGTKGKGSTSALLAAILHAAGYDVGVYSSPHLLRLEERFTINGAAIGPDEFVSLVNRLRPVVQQMDEAADATNDPSQRPTFFELTTALALMHFAEAGVDATVLEVGLGGRLDSTNVCQPAVSVITSISLDHTRQLGDTTAKIAAEKGGIIKPGVPVLLGEVDDAARAVLAELARRHGSRVIEAPRDFQFAYRAPHEVDAHAAAGRLDFSMDAGDAVVELHDAPLALLGRHQAANAALALATIVELRRQGWLVSADALRAGLASATLAGRIEVVGRRPTVVIDVAHNVASVEALVASLAESFACERRVLLFAASRDKDVPGMLRVLLPYFQRIVLTEFQENPRAVPAEQLAAWCREELARLGRPLDDEHVAACPAPGDGWRQAQRWTAPDDLLCITGSFFIAAELLPQATSADEAGAT